MRAIDSRQQRTIISQHPWLMADDRNPHNRLWVSAVIPAHNRRQMLCRALDSVLTQTRPPDEVLVVDDGSTDGTPDMIRRHYPQVTCLEQTNRGVSAARNRGIRRAQHQWIALLDSDDVWLPEKLQAQLEAADQQPRHRFFHTDEQWIRRGERVNPRKKHRKYGGYIFDRCLPLCVISPSSALIHHSVFDEAGVFDEQLPACEDYDLWLRICLRMPVVYIEQPLIIKYGGHADQLSRSVPALDRHRIQALENILRDPMITTEQQRLVVEELLRKLRIYMNGVRKRGRDEELQRCREMWWHYRNQLDSLQDLV